MGSQKCAPAHRSSIVLGSTVGSLMYKPRFAWPSSLGTQQKVLDCLPSFSWLSWRGCFQQKQPGSQRFGVWKGWFVVYWLQQSKAITGMWWVGEEGGNGALKREDCEYWRRGIQTGSRHSSDSSRPSRTSTIFHRKRKNRLSLRHNYMIEFKLEPTPWERLWHDNQATIQHKHRQISSL